MAYCRFSYESDVYIFPTDTGFECCMCSLYEKTKSIFTTGTDENYPIFKNLPPCKSCKGQGCDECMISGNTRMKTYEEVLLHLEEHVKNGDKVPEYAIERIKKEMEKNDKHT